MADNSQYDRKKNNSTNYVHPNEQNLWEVHKAMAYNPYGRPVLTVDDDTVQHTSTNRRKVSTKELIFFNTAQYDTTGAVWDQETTGGGTVTFDELEAATVLSVDNTPGSEAVIQTRKIIPYVPSRQNEMIIGVRLGSARAPGIRRRVGLFDEEHGIYFENNGDEYYCVLRRQTLTGTEELRVERADWTIDKLDGLGPSGITADPLTQQVFVIEYEWHGSGQVEFSWLINNNKIPIHQFNTANVLDYPYMDTPFLPLRAECTNMSATDVGSELYVNSFAVSSESESVNVGAEKNAATPIIGRTASAANTFYPILSVRLRDDRLHGVADLTDFQAATLDNTSIFYQIILNPVLTGASWVTAQPENFVEYDVSATSYTNGEVIKTGYLGAEQQGQLFRITRDTLNQLGRQNMGATSDIVTVAIATTGANKQVFASINWLEVR